MAIVSGNIIGNLSGKLGNLAARARAGRTVLSARPSSFNASQTPSAVARRQKFTMTAKFASAVLTLPALLSVWSKVRNVANSVFNEIFQCNFAYSAVDKPTENNITTPGGFFLIPTVAAVGSDKITASLPALNTASLLVPEETDLSANALVCLFDSSNPVDEPFKFITLSKKIARFDFMQSYELQIDFTPIQTALAAKYQHSILYLSLVTKTGEGKVVQNSGTFTKIG